MLGSKKASRRGGASAPRTEGGLSALAGLVLLLGAFLMLTFTPQRVYRACNAAGYRATEAELVAPPVRNSRYMRLRVLSTGEELLVRRSSFEADIGHPREAVWYNPAAHLVLGIRWFDERLVSRQRYPDSPSPVDALVPLLLTIALGGYGSHLLVRANRSSRSAA